MGAVTTERTPVPGCRVQPLGVMRYVPVASPSYVAASARWLHRASRRRGSVVGMEPRRRPPGQLVRKAFRRAIARPLHYRADGGRLRRGCARRFGVGVFPDSCAAPHLRDGSFVRVSDVHLDVPLYWQCWKLDSPIIKRITDTVRSAAAGLHRPRKTS